MLLPSFFCSHYIVQTTFLQHLTWNNQILNLMMRLPVLRTFAVYKFLSDSCRFNLSRFLSDSCRFNEGDHYIQNLNYQNHPVSYFYVLTPPAGILAIQGCNCLSQITDTFIPIITYLSINCFHHSCLQKPKNTCLCVIFDHYCQIFTYGGETGHQAVSLFKFETCPILPNFL